MMVTGKNKLEMEVIHAMKISESNRRLIHKDHLTNV
jgi:hypothetical protein